MELAMSLVPIREIGDPVLRRPTRPIERRELASDSCQRFIDDLVETMRHAGGAGIAANQVGDGRRICAIEIADNPRYPYKPAHPLTILVNPVMAWRSEKTYWNNEGCLSVPDLRGDLHRSIEVHVQAWDRDGISVEHRFRGLTAGTAQHELDHLDGGLFVDRVEDTRTLATWRQFDLHQKERFTEHIRRVVEETT
jgi:peptide deformylase